METVGIQAAEEIIATSVEPIVQVVPVGPIEPAQEVKKSHHKKRVMKKSRGNPNFRKGHANPYQAQLNVRQRKYIKSILAGRSKAESVRIAGYGKSMDSSHVEQTPKMKNALCEAMVRNGIDEESLSQKIKDGLNANETKFFSHEGIVTDQRDIPNYSVREKYLRDALEVRGEIRGNTIDSLSVGIIQIPAEVTKEQWNQVVQPEPIDTKSSNEI